MLTVNDIIKGKVEGLAFGGEGIIKHQGFVIFVPFTAPGDIIFCRIIKLKKSYATGEIVEVLEESNQRTKPKCPYFGTCGGCQFQHLSYNFQLEHKKKFIEDAFLRVGQLDNVKVNNVIASENQYHYRRHISLSVKKSALYPNDQTAGYTTLDNKSHLSIHECPIFIENQNSILKEIQDFVRSFKMIDETAKVTVLKDEMSTYVLHFHFKNLPENSKSLMKDVLKTYPSISGVTFGSKTSVLNKGKKSVRYDIYPSSMKNCNLTEPKADTSSCLGVNPLSFVFSTDVFMQNNPEQSLNIYRKIEAIAKEAKVDEVLDLYCGIGISSLLLAHQGMSVLGIECNHRSIKMAIKNAELNQIKNARFIHASVEDVLKKTKIPDFVIINPPREGLNIQVIECLKKRLPKRIIYISCMPSTLARDLKLLGKKNYRIEECQPYDMFPQTTHVETLISLVRQSND